LIRKDVIINRFPFFSNLKTIKYYI
jgi:hypothetical protein